MKKIKHSIRDESERLPIDLCEKSETKKMLESYTNEEKTFFFEEGNTSNQSPKLSPKSSVK